MTVAVIKANVGKVYIVVNKRLDLVFRAVSEKDVGQARLGDNLALALDKFNHFYRGTKNRNSFFLQIFTRILLPSIGAAQSVPMRGCCLFASDMDEEGAYRVDTPVCELSADTMP